MSWIGYFILAAVFLLIAAFQLIKMLRALPKDKEAKGLSKKQVHTLILSGIDVFAAGILLFCAFISSHEMDVLRIVLLGLGAPLFLLSFVGLWVFFYLYFYCPHYEKKVRKIFEICMYSCIPAALLFFLVAGEGFGPYLEYPLTCGFSINETGFHWLTAANVGDHAINSGLAIRWYGVIIVFGALTCYWISDHKFYQKYGRHGILESTLLVAFPGGILGARIWYVVGNWHEFAYDWTRIFAMTDGGLTILGGAVGGILAGVAWVLWRRKWVDIRFAMEVVVPTILIGQAIGRWGNFFNNEVYGQVVALNNGWSWLPSWIAGQMHYDGATRTFLAEGMINTPLFLIESMINILGYYIIAYIVPRFWKNKGLGVSAGLYLTWYGIVRVVMEPLRNPAFNMGTDGMWSVYNSLIYIGLGILLAVTFQLFWVFQKGKSWARGSMEAVAEEKASGRVKPVKNDVSNAPKLTIKEEDKESE